MHYTAVCCSQCITQQCVAVSALHRCVLHSMHYTAVCCTQCITQICVSLNICVFCHTLYCDSDQCAGLHGLFHGWLVAVTIQPKNKTKMTKILSVQKNGQKKCVNFIVEILQQRWVNHENVIWNDNKIAYFLLRKKLHLFVLILDFSNDWTWLAILTSSAFSDKKFGWESKKMVAAISFACF